VKERFTSSSRKLNSLLNSVQCIWKLLNNHPLKRVIFALKKLLCGQKLLLLSHCSKIWGIFFTIKYNYGELIIVLHIVMLCFSSVSPLS